MTPGRAFVAAGFVAGLALRVWVLASPIGGLDGDEAVWGLMARHALDGELSTFFWGQTYGGTQEALLTAPVFAVSGSGALTVRVVPMLLFALAAVLVWRVGLRTVGERAAVTGAVLFWVAPSYMIWKSTRAHGYYGVALVLSLVILLVVLRLRERDSRADRAVLGLALGLGWWATPQIALVAVPACAWLIWRRPAVLRGAGLVAVCALVAAAPWVVWNVEHELQSVRRPIPEAEDTYFDHLRTFFYATFPTALGIRAPFSLDWLPGEVAGRALEGLALLGFVWLLVRRRGRREVLLVVAVCYPFLQSLSPLAALNEEPRYLVLLAPVIALLLGELASQAAAGPWIALAVTGAASVIGLASMGDIRPPVPPVGTARVPADLGPALRVLERAGVDRVLAHYSIAYRISFETRERIIASSTSQVRYGPHDRLVRSAEHPAYVYVAGSRFERAAARWLAMDGYRRVPAGAWAVYLRGP
jgi:4-amino-4-deoxy-L-arabinose transferase-like glycosyltransferase